MAAKRLRPVHPGDTLLHDFMEPLKLSSYKLARESTLTSRASATERRLHRKRATFRGTREPHAYLSHLFAELPKATALEHFEALLPWDVKQTRAYS